MFSNQRFFKKYIFKDNTYNLHKVILALLTIIIFMPLIKISFSEVEKSISIIKYHWQWGVGDLIKNYNLYLDYPRLFFLDTLKLHQGNSPSGWSTAFYLFPLFLFIRVLGGLSIKNIYLFTIIVNLIALFLFYLFIKKIWGKKVAFFSVLFMGYSAVFQEFGRSGTYVTISILFALVWVYLIYGLLDKKYASGYLLLGIVSGIGMYGYGALRSIIFVQISALIIEKYKKTRKIILFILGFLSIVLPGVYFKISSDPAYYHMHPILSFFDPESIFNRNFFEIFRQNISDFIKRITGGKQIIPSFITNNYHAHFIHPLLAFPFFLGFVKNLFRLKEKKYLMLIVTSFFIFVVPMFTSNWGYHEARRSSLYLIPIYLYVGLGTELIFDFIRLKRKRIFKFGGFVCIFIFTVFIIKNEFFYIKRYILNGERDIGILDFSYNIKKINPKGNIYYLILDSEKGRKNIFRRSDSVYLVTEESIILKLALMDKNNKNPEVTDIHGFSSLLNSSSGFYLAKSPLFSNEKFQLMCKQHSLNCQLLISTPLKNYNNPRDLAFNFYYISR